MVSKERKCHAKINLEFGDGLVKMNFDPTKRSWNVKKKADESDLNETAQPTPLESLQEVDIS